ncbi:hypothetical protein GF386_05540 [Candidatus Pacearchaeota archaeon]|nr:hypothetical protein [Candidatus Pacearchaeota archaeon]MBD3283563.1 hypothetical protein [Candidatus Pacearchaeota archaeon]
MKIKREYVIIFAVFLIVIGLFLIFRLRVDSWIKDSKGVWIKSGSPDEIPDYVDKQQRAIRCAGILYEKAEERGMEFSSQCLGVCGDYAVDIVHVPRINEDDKIENQCESFRNKEVSNFIELDKKGGVVRIFEK